MGDVTRRCRLVQWEGDVDRLTISECYRLEAVSVRMYEDVKYLYMSESIKVIEISGSTSKTV